MRRRSGTGPGAIAGALALRRWALSSWGAGDPPVPPLVTPAAWRVFLESERCAAWLHRRMGSSAPAGGPLIEAAQRELQRTLLARGELTRLAPVCRREGVQVAVLKGGLPVAEGADTVYVEDLDLLARPDQARHLAHVLEGSGYLAHGYRTAHHLRPRRAAGGLPVEIHLALLHSAEVPGADLWQAVRPVRGLEGAFALGAADHLWQVLMHSAVHHPERRGRIRDLLLVADALARCTAGERAAVERRLAEAPAADRLRVSLQVAERLASGSGVGRDPFERDAAARYAVMEFFLKRRLPAVLESAVGRSLADRLFGPRPPVPIHSVEPSGVAHIAWLERRAPALALRWRQVLQWGEGMVASAVAWPLALVLRRRAFGELGMRWGPG